MNSFNRVKRFAARMILVTPVLLAGTGCGIFQLNDYSSFDDWFAGRGGQEFDPNTLSCGCDDTTFPGYVGNAIIRTPVYFFYDVTIIAMIPVAAPYYCCTSFFGEEEKKSAYGSHDHGTGAHEAHQSEATSNAPEATTATTTEAAKPEAAKPEAKPPESDTQETPSTTSP